MNTVFRIPFAYCLGFCFLFVLNLSAQNDKKRPLTLDDLLQVKHITEAQISPDGQWIAFVAVELNMEENKRNTEVWVVNPYGPTTTRLTEEPGKDEHIQWSGDSKFIAFISDRDSLPQVFGVSPDGGGAFKITDFPTAVNEFRISDDGKKIAIVAKPEKTEEQEEKEKEMGRPIVMEQYYDDEWDQLWVASMNENLAGEFSLKSLPNQFVSNPFWSPDGGQLVYCSKPNPSLRSILNTDIYIIPESGVSTKLTSMQGQEVPVSWTEANGLIVSGTNQRIQTVNRQLWSINLKNGIPNPLTPSIDEHAIFVGITEDFIYVEAAAKTFKRLFKIPIKNGNVTGAPKIVSDDKMFYSFFSMTEDGETLAFVGEQFDKAPELYFAKTVDFKPQQATELNPQLAEIEFGKQRVVQWKSRADGELIEGVLTLPANYDKDARVPLLLVIHGGPAGVSPNRFMVNYGAYPAQVFAGKGYAVLQPNYRGSTGYGERFRGLNIGDISGKDWIDIDSGVDEMIKQGIADADKLGIMGWSFGGHLTYWGITQTNRYKVASAGAGANDLISMYSQTDYPEFYQTYLGPKPWENFNLYEERSAYRLVNKVVTPLLIQVGENDRRVPKDQSIQFYEAVKSLGKTAVNMVIYPGQGHSIQEPLLIKDLIKRNLDWVEKWIKVRK